MTEIIELTPEKKKELQVQKQYFTQTVQDAVLQYVASVSSNEKNDLYKTIIGPKMKELIDNIVQVYKFGSLPNISLLKEDCLLYLISVLNKFDPDKISKRTQKKSKAFTYFTVVAKHWFFAAYKKHKKRKFEEINFDELYKVGGSKSQCSIEPSLLEQVVTYNEYDIYLERHEFKKALLSEMKQWTDSSKHDEHFHKTILSIYVLVENVDEIDFFNKKGIFVYLRELTGLETKEISSSLKKMSIMFRLFKNRWDGGKI